MQEELKKGVLSGRECVRGGGSQMCEEGGNLKLKSEAVSCVRSRG